MEFSLPMFTNQIFNIPEKTQDEKEEEWLRLQLEEFPPEVTMEDLIEIAVRRKNVEAATVLIRRHRNVLLAQTDKEVSLDRLNLTMPTGILFTDWIKFFKQIAELLTGDWAKYRQALRDIPQQEGFPLNVKWPTRPEG